MSKNYFLILRFKQCDQIGRFLKVLCNTFCYQSSPNIWKCFGVFCSVSLFKKNCFGFFLGNNRKIWVTFNSSIWSHWFQVTSHKSFFRHCSKIIYSRFGKLRYTGRVKCSKIKSFLTLCIFAWVNKWCKLPHFTQRIMKVWTSLDLLTALLINGEILICRLQTVAYPLRKFSITLRHYLHLFF